MPASPELTAALLSAASVVREAINPWLMFLAPSTREEFVRSRLEGEMRRHRGKKRLRKKKAQRALEHLWLLRTLAKPVARRLDYATLARQLFPVEPMPPVTGGAW